MTARFAVSGQEANEVSATYTSNGRVATVADANNNKTTYEYDGHDRLVKTRMPDPGTPGTSSTSDYEQLTLDAVGNITARRLRDGNSIGFTYDALNRLARKTVPERAGLAATHTRDVFYGYDLRGLPLSARFDSQSGQGVTNAYDAFGRLASSSINMGGATRTLSYQHDPAGNRTQITHPDGLYFTYQYDALNRLDTAYQGVNALVDMSYNAQGRLTGRSDGTAGAGGTATLTWDAAGRLATLAHDLSGTSRDVSWTYGYNPAGQIVSTTRSNDAFAWTGHSTGSSAYTADGLNRYSAPGTFAYDANGNLTGDGATTFTYDVENRLVAASGARNGTLVYDPLGRIFQYGAGGTTLTFLYDGDALVAEYDTTGARLRAYAHGPAGGADDPLVWYQGTQRRFLRTDHQGSIVQTAGSTGTPFDTNAYDEYGIPAAGNAGRFQYTGQIWLAELGLYHYKARIYNPTLGRFLQTDPVGYEGGMNLYAYVGNDPVNFSDPLGLQESDPDCQGLLFDADPHTVCVTGPGPQNVDISGPGEAAGVGSAGVSGTESPPTDPNPDPRRDRCGNPLPPASRHYSVPSGYRPYAVDPNHILVFDRHGTVVQNPYFLAVWPSGGGVNWEGVKSDLKEITVAVAIGQLTGAFLRQFFGPLRGAQINVGNRVNTSAEDAARSPGGQCSR